MPLMVRDESLVTHSVVKIARGGLLIFSTLVIAYVIAFISRIILARYLGPNDFGLFNLGITIIGIAGIFSTLSIPIGIARYIPLYREKKQDYRVRGVILTSLKLTCLLSFIVTLILFLLSGYLTYLYNSPELKWVIIIFAISLPFTAFSTTFSAIFQGFEDARPSAIFKNLLMNCIRIGFYAIVIILGLGLIGVTWSYTIAILVATVSFAIYFLRTVSRYLSWEWNGSQEYGTLLTFSMPMFIANIATNLAGQINLLILGRFHPISDIGVYTAAILLSSILLFFIESISFLYLPVFTSLFAAGKKQEMNKTYQIMTKWMVFASLPLIWFFIFYPSGIISLIFGEEYASGGLVLIITSVATFFGLVSSLAWSSLIAMGKTTLCMTFSIVLGVTGITAGVLLIPPLGITGTAITSLVQYMIAMIITFFAFYNYTRTHPFTSSLIKPAGLFILLSALTYLIVAYLHIEITLFTLIILLFIFYFLMVLSTMLGSGLEKNDLEILLKIERKIGLNLHPLRQILKKIIR